MRNESTAGEERSLSTYMHESRALLPSLPPPLAHWSSAADLRYLACRVNKLQVGKKLVFPHNRGCSAAIADPLSLVL